MGGERVTLRRLGDRPYRGYDLDGKVLSVGPGEPLECTARRAEMLLRDFPRGFEVVGAAVAEAASARGGSGEPAPTTTEPEAPQEAVAGASGAPHGLSGESGTGSAPVASRPKRGRRRAAR